MCLGLESFQWILTCNPFSQDTLSTGSIMGCNSEFLSVFFYRAFGITRSPTSPSYRTCGEAGVGGGRGEKEQEEETFLLVLPNVHKE